MVSNSYTILGSSSGMPNPNRASSSYLLQVGDSLSMIDCGSGAVASLLRCKFDLLKVDRVFISHTHSDHVSDLALLIQAFHVQNANKHLTIYMPEEFVEAFKQYSLAVYQIPGRMRLTYEFIGYKAGFIYDEAFSLEAFGNNHHQSARETIEELKLPNQMQSHSFKIKVNDKELFHSADLGSFDDIKSYLNDSNILVVETTHVPIEEIIEYATMHRDKQIVLTHLGNQKEVKQIERILQDVELPNIIVGYDGLKINL